MSRFTHTEYRQLLDMFDVESESPKFSSTFTKALRLWREPLSTIDPMRRGFNFFVVELLKGYRISTDDVYQLFDNAWEKAVAYGKFEEIDEDGAMWWVWRVLNLPNPELLVGHRAWRLRATWRRYKELLREIVEQRARIELQHQEQV